MPLERRVQSLRSYQGQCRGRRQQPYRLPSSFRGARQEGVAFGRDAPVRLPLEHLVKHHGTCLCSTYDVPIPMQTDDVHPDTLLEVEPGATQRLSSDQRPQTNLYHGSWHSDNSTLRPDLTNNSNQGIHTTELRVDNISSDSSSSSSGTSSVISDQSLMIPNVVPMPISSELSQPVAFVTNPNRPPPDEVLSSRSQSRPICFQRDLYNTDASEQFKTYDRSAQEYYATGDVESTYSSASFRSCRRSMCRMAPPSAHARKVASRVIKHARDNSTPDERSLWCSNCKRLPVLPVTGQCGHTRCTRCIQDNGACPCGVQAPKSLHVNTLIQGLIIKITSVEPSFSVARLCGGGLSPRCRSTSSLQAALPANVCGRRPRGASSCATGRMFSSETQHHAPMALQCRLEAARRLVAAGRHREAAAHLARVAARPGALASIARTLLAQCISVMSCGADARRLTRGLYRAVRAQAAGAWLRARDLECALCYHAYTSPVTTPCGHTYCRTCIERSMDYRKSCALCLRPLDDFDLATTRETVFVCAALQSIGALTPPAPPPDPDVIPIFVCTVAYPAIPCPLFIFDPRYWLMIRRVLAGSRKFGMVAYERERSYSDYGTVLEVCDCVHLEDGRSILSTVGVSRFRVIERDVRDGCDVARIQSLTDITPTEELVIWELRIMAMQVSYKALLWLNTMSARVRAEIETAFGRRPHFDRHDWWESPDGPAWMWWLIAILPLRSEIKILILSTKSLVKRMMAVSRTLDAIEQMGEPNGARTECALRRAISNAEEWLERSAQ